MERRCRQQVLIEAPVQVVWDLLGDPNRHPEWWPTVVDTECEQIEEGCRYHGVIKSPGPFGGEEDHVFTIESLDTCHEVMIRCEDVGGWTRFGLTEAQGGTFVDAEFGIEPQDTSTKMIVSVAGRRVLRRWLEQSIAALEQAATSAAARRAA